MIIRNQGKIFALLDNKRVCEWNDCAQESIDPIVNDGEVSIADLFQSNNLVVALTHDQRVIMYMDGFSRHVDITPAIHKALEGTEAISINKGTLSLDTNINLGIHVINKSNMGYRTVTNIIITTDKSICMLKTECANISFGPLPSLRPNDGKVIFYSKSYPEKAHPIYGVQVSLEQLYTYPSGIDFMRVGNGYGHVKTNDNKIHLLRSQWYPTIKESRLLDIDNAGNISEIVTHFDTYFLMNNGTVFAQYLFRGSDIIQVNFGEEVFITRIITAGCNIFYIANETCYTGVPDSNSNTIKYSHIKALDNHQVENAYEIGGYVAIQYDGWRLCLLREDSHVVCMDHINGTKKPIYLDYFDDKCVTNIIQGAHGVYFATSDGKVYHGVIYDTHDTDPTIQISEIPFFNDNPVAIKSSMTKIRSARSSVQDS